MKFSLFFLFFLKKDSLSFERDARLGGFHGYILRRIWRIPCTQPRFSTPRSRHRVTLVKENLERTRRKREYGNVARHRAERISSVCL